MYLFQKKRRKAKPKEKPSIVLPKAKAYKNVVLSKTCPHCTHRLIEQGKTDEEVTFECTGCHKTYNFQQLRWKNTVRRQETRYKSFTLLDRSDERTKPYDYTNTIPVARNKQVDAEHLAKIRQSMESKKMLQFSYPMGNSLKERLVEPYKLTCDGSQNAILYAYCTEGEGIRIFKINRMENVRLSEYDFQLKWTIEDKLDGAKNPKGA